MGSSTNTFLCSVCSFLLARRSKHVCTLWPGWLWLPSAQGIPSPISRRFLALCLVCALCSVSTSAPLSSMGDSPFWINPFGTDPYDLTGIPEETLDSLRNEQYKATINSAVTAWNVAQNILPKIVKQFEDKNFENGMIYKNVDWIPGVPEISDDQLEESVMDKKEDTMRYSYSLIQHFAVGFDRIKDESSYIQKHVEDIIEKLKPLIGYMCESMKFNNWVPKDVTREVMPKDSFQESERNERDYVLLRDYIKTLEYIQRLFSKMLQPAGGEPNSRL